MLSTAFWFAWSMLCKAVSATHTCIMAHPIFNFGIWPWSKWLHSATMRSTYLHWIEWLAAAIHNIHYWYLLIQHMLSMLTHKSTCKYLCIESYKLLESCQAKGWHMVVPITLIDGNSSLVLINWQGSYSLGMQTTLINVFECSIKIYWSFWIYLIMHGKHFEE